MVLRLLDKSGGMLSLEDIGFASELFPLYTRMIRRSYGIILVTGPTGSGKSTTLYATLLRLNSAELNIITVEDPIEYQLNGVGQIQVNPKIDLTFANGLRSILRQDPDIIMVGEIRDRETAEIAIQAPPGTGCLAPCTQRQRQCGHTPDRHGRRALPDLLVGPGDDGPAPVW
jgi:general secretion pathway protein E